MNGQRRLLVFVSGIALSASLVACGGSDDDTASANAAASSSTAPDAEAPTTEANEGSFTVSASKICSKYFERDGLISVPLRNFLDMFDPETAEDVTEDDIRNDPAKSKAREAYLAAVNNLADELEAVDPPGEVAGIYAAAIADIRDQVERKVFAAGSFGRPLESIGVKGCL